ncbi:MAG: helix-turn-helix domain-containing protein [Clostridiales bacterium]|jgi:transcriptional regulator with XRE-family HTH domain|nr:helix-turn-helix domain-containing protein [Clostridiales bacterium]
MKEPNRIKDLREEKNMTQLRLSVELEVSQETVSAYEIGKHYPSAKSLMRMAELFDASMDYIMGLSPVRRIISESALPDDEARLLSLYRKLDRTGREKAHSYLHGMTHDI